MKRTLSMIRNQIIAIGYMIIIFFIVATANTTEKITTNNVNSVSSLQAIHLVSKYDPNIVETKFANSFDEIFTYAPTNPVKYQGTMTGYGPDCYGCGNSVACAPYPIVTDTIYFNDYEYGQVRILAADKKIPCGTIAKVHGSTEGEFIGIVIDRGGVIKGTLMDLLFNSEKTSSPFGRQNVEYEIIRWGW